MCMCMCTYSNQMQPRSITFPHSPEQPKSITFPTVTLKQTFLCDPYIYICVCVYLEKIYDMYDVLSPLFHREVVSQAVVTDICAPETV